MDDNLEPQSRMAGLSEQLENNISALGHAEEKNSSPGVIEVGHHGYKLTKINCLIC